MFWILVGIVLSVLFYTILVKPFRYWSDREVPQLNVWTIWLGIFKGLLQLKPIAEAFREFYDKYSDRRYAGIYQFFLPTLVLRDPDLIKQITIKDFDYFTDHKQVFLEDSEQPLWEKNLISLKGDKWQEMRATLNPSFTSSKMRAMFGLMCERAEQSVRHFQNQSSNTITVEMKDAFGRFAADIIASTAFGVTCDSLKDPENEFYKLGKNASNFNSVKFIVLFVAPRLAKMLGLKFFDNDIRAYFKSIVVKTIKIRVEKNIFRPDMIHLLMEAGNGKLKHENYSETVDAGFVVTKDAHVENKEVVHKQLLGDDDITAQAFIFFLGGFDTVSSAMSFSAYELAVNTDIQKRLQCEIDDTLSGCSGSITYDALMKMKYLDMVVSESLRKWPPAIAVDRLCVKPYTIQPERVGEKPVHLIKGDIVILPIFALHRDPFLYPEPERFDPERFSDENKSNINPYTYIPFGIGPRTCIGNRFALMEVKIVLFNLLSKFDIKVVEKTTVPLQIGTNPINLSSRGGFWLGLKARK